MPRISQAIVRTAEAGRGPTPSRDRRSAPDDGASTPRRRPTPSAGAKRRPAKRRRPSQAVVLARAGASRALAVGAWYGYDWWTVGRFMVSTDDAYVQADIATLAAKSPGYVADVAVDDNQQVKAGDVIARIDDGDYRLAVRPARGQARDPAGDHRRASASRSRPQQAGVDQAEAQLAAAQGRRDPRRARARSASRQLAKRRLRQPASGSSRRRPTATRPRPRCTSAEAAIDRRAGQRRGAQGAAGRGAARTLERVADRARQGRARPLLHGDPRAVRRRRRQPRRAGRRLRRSRARGSRPGAARRASMSTPTSRRRSSRGCSRARRCTIAVDAFPDTRHRRHGRERRAGLRLGVQPAAARERHRQLHQDRAARAGAHPRAGRTWRGRACCARACRSSSSVDTRTGRSADRAGRASGERGRWPMAAAAPPRRAVPGTPAADAGRRIDPRRPDRLPRAWSFGMFMAILDIQIVSASLAEIQAGLSACADEISWVQTTYLIAEVDHDPAVGLPVARARRRAGCSRSRPRGFTVTSLLCATATSIDADDRLPRAAGLHRRRHDPDRVRRRLHDLPARRKQRHDLADDRPGRDAGADHRPDGRRLPHRRCSPGTGCSWSTSCPASSSPSRR